MYYDLIASLPHLPHFATADRLPITPLRLQRRLGRLRPEHMDQLDLVRPLVRWRATQLLTDTDATFVAAFKRLNEPELNPALREFVTFRMSQQTLIAALRRKLHKVGPPENKADWGAGPHVHLLRKNWNAPYFGLEYRFPWLPEAAERLTAEDAVGLEQLLIELNWGWLTRCAEKDMFGFQAVVAFVLKWDMLRAWLEGNAQRARIRFTELVDKVTHVEVTE